MFVCKYGLTGFYTGMIVSDYEEAMLYSLRADLKEIEQSNLLFADALKQAINSRDMLGIVQDFYEGESEVINFNRKNLYQT